METKQMQISEELLNKVKSYQEKAVITVSKLGDIELQLSQLNKTKSELIAQYESNAIGAQELVKVIESTYGSGTLDIYTGILTLK